MVVTILNIALWVFSICGYIIYNLYNKNLKLEEVVLKQDRTLNSLQEVITESDRVLKEVDRLGAFKSDDEIGFFFQTVRSIQETLNQFTNKK